MCGLSAAAVCEYETVAVHFQRISRLGSIFSRTLSVSELAYLLAVLKVLVQVFFKAPRIPFNISGFLPYFKMSMLCF